jgi:hypothetical protein
MSVNAETLLSQLQQDKLRRDLVDHALFRQIETRLLSRAEVAILLGQWWHPLHYFPTFLSRATATITALEIKTAIATILFQELGEGNPKDAHERIYVDTMSRVGFSSEEIVDAKPLVATLELVEGYKRASTSPSAALGFVYGTEVADLAMVSSIGRAVTRLTGVRELRWVDIHVSQEPNHVHQASSAVGPSVSPLSVDDIRSSAKRVWHLWINFFSDIEKEMEKLPKAARIA